MEVISKLVEIPISIDRMSIALITEYSKVSIRRTTSKIDKRLRVYIDSIFVGRLDSKANELVYQHIISNRKFFSKVTTAKYYYRPQITIQVNLIGDLMENNYKRESYQYSRYARNCKVTAENWLNSLRRQFQGLESVSGIYRIYNKTSGMSYIGQSTDLNRRLFSEHLNNLLQGKHPNHKLQHDWNLKPNSIHIEVLASGTPVNDLNELEAKYIHMYQSYTHGYNQTFDGHSSPQFAGREELLLEFSYANRRELDIG
ncbi:GIY-YIG nuclease family protein [Vibrio cholerae]|uniref:GIY-YIG nuclease family protein n=1 Tax=Vibrio cholerae TaxID=666 RepID=UPI0039679E56